VSGRVREGQLDLTPRAPQVPRWPGCRCDEVEKGGCRCYQDDGLVSHGGVRHEGFDHGEYRSGDFVRA
jgi:hypothetical protein